jgi:hypothetical protein
VENHLVAESGYYTVRGSTFARKAFREKSTPHLFAYFGPLLKTDALRTHLMRDKPLSRLLDLVDGTYAFDLTDFKKKSASDRVNSAMMDKAELATFRNLWINGNEDDTLIGLMLTYALGANVRPAFLLIRECFKAVAPAAPASLESYQTLLKLTTTSGLGVPLSSIPKAIRPEPQKESTGGDDQAGDGDLDDLDEMDPLWQDQDQD